MTIHTAETPQPRMGRPIVGLVAAIAVILAGCTMPDGTVYTFTYDAAVTEAPSGQPVPDTGYEMTATVVESAALFDGPGSVYAITGAVKPGDELVVIGADAGQDWYLLDSSEWIAQDRVELEVLDFLPVLTVKDLPVGFRSASNQELDELRRVFGFQVDDPNVRVFSLEKNHPLQTWMVYGATSRLADQMEIDFVDAYIDDEDALITEFLGALVAPDSNYELLNVDHLGDSAFGITVITEAEGVPLKIGVVTIRIADVWILMFATTVNFGPQTERAGLTVEDFAATLAQKVTEHAAQLRPPVVAMPELQSGESTTSSPGMDNADAHFDRGVALLEAGELELAIGEFDEAIALNPQHAEAYYHRGLAFSGFEEFELSNYEQAVADFEKVVELEPSNAEAYHYLGVAIFEARENFRQALELFNKALELNPELAEAYYYRGLQYTNLDEFGQAIQDFDTAIELDTNFEAAYYYRAYVNRIELEDVEQAIHDLSTVIDLDGDYAAAAYTDRGSAHIALEEFDAAIRDYTEAIRIYPESKNARQGRAWAYKEVGEYGAAAQDCSDALKLSGGYLMPIQSCLAMMAELASRDFDDAAAAVESYDEAIARDPDFAVAYLLRGFAKWTLGDVEAAVQDMESALQLWPLLGIHFFIPMWDEAFDDPSDAEAVIEELEIARNYIEQDSLLERSIESTLTTLQSGE